jgi:hypothetical protein
VTVNTLDKARADARTNHEFLIVDFGADGPSIVWSFQKPSKKQRCEIT